MVLDVRQRKRDYIKLAKLRVVEGYGSRCSCLGCTETRWEFLTIDHIEGGGNEDRRTTLMAGAKLYGWLIRNNYPRGKYQLLCYNCNCARQTNGGVCPHIRPVAVPAPARECVRLGSKEVECSICYKKFNRRVKLIRSNKQACSVKCRNLLVAHIRWNKKLPQKLGN
jgi:hypothetical protein